MRHPPSGLGIMLLWVFLVGGLASPLLAAPARAFGEHGYEANPVLGPGDPHLDVYAGQTMAQSFTASATYSLFNVTLRLRNAGGPTNTITVSIRPDDPVNHTPASTSLATALVATIDGAPPANVSIVFSPAPVVDAGGVYWIVASSGAAQSSGGYQWYHSNADTYPGGHADLYNATAGAWASLLTDMYFVNFGRDLAPRLSTGMSVDRAEARPDDFVNFTLFYNNSGTQLATRVWINDTLPSSLSYVSDTSPPGSLRSTTPALSYVLENVSNGPHSFRIMLRADVGTPPGTTATNRMDLAFVNGTGGVETVPGAQASVLIGLATKQLYLSQAASPGPYWLTTVRPTGITPAVSAGIGRGAGITYGLTPVLAGPFQTSNVTAILWVNSGSGNARFLNFNVSVLDSGTLVGYAWHSLTTSGTGPDSVALAFPIASHTFAANRAIQLRVFNDASSSENMVVLSNATSTPSRVAFVTTTYVSVTSISPQDGSGPASYWSPLDPLVVDANVSDPFGSGKILGAWVNVTSPSGGSSSVLLTVPWTTDPSVPSSWKHFRASYSPPLQNGTYRVLVTGIEDNGVRDLAAADATVRSPSFTFAKTASVLRAMAGERFSYQLWFNNTGTGPAGQVWINDSLPSQLVLESSNSTPPGTYTGDYNWTWSSVGPGDHALVVNVSVGGSVNQAAWIRNSAVLAFSDEKGYLWPGMDAHVDVVINGPIVDVALSTDPGAQVHTNESVVYTVNLTNRGDVAQTLWLNDTMPVGFTFLGSTANLYGGSTTVAGDEVLFTFADMPSGGSWPFNFTLRAGQGMPLGAAYTSTLGVNYTSLNSVLMPPRVLWTSLVSSFPVFANGTVDVLATQAVPEQTIPITVTYSNSGTEPARDAWLNLTLDPLLALTNASQLFVYSPPRVYFALANVSVGLHALFLNVTLDAASPDRYVARVRGQITYTDAIGNLQPSSTFTEDQVTVTSPAMALSVSPGNVTIEAGTPLTYGVYFINSGSGNAADAWLNMTVASAFDFLGDTSNASRTNVGANYSWHWANFAPGSRSFSVYLAARATTPDNTLGNVAFRLEYQDSNHISKAPVTMIAVAKVVAPAILLTLGVDRTEAFAGDTVTYALEVHNAGETSARWVSVNDDVDTRLEILTYSSSVPATGTQSLSWNLTDLAPGRSEWINLTVRVRPGVSADTRMSNVFEVLYSNSLGGGPLGYVRSASADLHVVADLTGLIWMALAGGVAGPALAWFVARRQRVTIEEVFLVYRDGVLISHLSRSLVPDKDEDVLSGMLTAVQEFVRDAFRYGEHRELHQMDFGEYRILIERGKLAYLAVVYSGKNSSLVGKRVRTVLDRIESTYAGVLEAWDGDMEQVVGARDIIRDYLLKSNGRGRNRTNGS